jgi:hypothetical protein
MKKLLLAAAVSLALATPAFAHMCPSLMAQIDEAMKTAQLDDATKTKIMDLYNKGKAEHESGDHDASVTDLQAALKLLGK